MEHIQPDDCNVWSNRIYLFLARIIESWAADSNCRLLDNCTGYLYSSKAVYLSIDNYTVCRPRIIRSILFVLLESRSFAVLINSVSTSIYLCTCNSRHIGFGSLKRPCGFTEINISSRKFSAFSYIFVFIVNHAATHNL